MLDKTLMPVAACSSAPLGLSAGTAKLPTIARPQGTSVFVAADAGWTAGIDAARPAASAHFLRARTNKHYPSGPPRDRHPT